ncbi:carboxypeptidase regulatory-like domain-containing protein [Granulicella arctica]|nr:carboxypeptidase regulatory-like domain-containing protein [Granulicella arctica]
MRVSICRLITYFLCFGILLYSTESYAQNAVSTGAITGTVRDASGALLANVVVTVVSDTTGMTLSAKTNSDGIFSFPALPVGAYKASFSATGFKKTQIQNLSVGVGHTADAEAVLSIGDISQQVVVEATGSDLNPTDTTVGTLIEKSTIDGLPLSGRRYTDFVLLTPNVTADGQFGHISFAGQSGGDLSGYNNTAGGASNANGASAFTVDGSDATSYYYGDNRGFTRIPYIFGLQAIQEFQVQPNVYNAAYGGAGAGFINTVTKSGTNQYHGDLFYYNRNSGTGANDAVDKAAGNPKLQNTLQQFGADIGGPIVKDKLFFYFDYEQQRHRDPLYALNQAQSAIDQTSFGVPSSSTLPAYNSHFPMAASISQDEATADPTNPIYLQGVANALHEIKSNLGPRARRRDDLEFFPKVDWQLSAKDRITMLYNYNNFKSPGGIITFSPEPFGADELLGNNGVKDHVATVHWTRVLNSSAVNDMHTSYVRDEQYYTPSGLVDPNAPEIILTAPSVFLMGNATFSYNNLREYQWQFADHVTLTHGKHQLEFGVDYNHDSIANSNPGTFNGQYIFLSLQAFALGKWNIFEQTTGNPKFNFSDPFTGFFLNDTYRITPNLTLTGGLREDFQIYPNPSGNPALPLTQHFNNQYQRVSPRFGFSYAPFSKTVVRGGAGLYYEIFVGGNYQNSTQTDGVLQTSLNLLDFSTSTLPTAQAVVFPNKLASNDSRFSGASNIVAISPNYKTPSVVNASLQIDQELAPQTILTVGSLWSHGMHLTSSTAYDLNRKQPTGTTTFVLPNGKTLVEPNLDTGVLQEGAISSSFNQINALISPGINNYVSLFTQLNRQVAHGANVIAAYTLSKSTQSGVDFYNQFNLGETRGLSLLDMRHRLSVGVVYRPEITTSNKAERLLLSDWTISTISQFNSGRPYTGVISSLNDTAALQATPNTAAGLVGGNSPGYGLAPGEGMNSFTGPWITEIDLGLERRFTIHEKQYISLKAQVFNLFNSPNYYVEAGSGINQVEYTATCGDGSTLNQTCTLAPNNGTGGFKTFTAVSQPNPPRIMQFSFGYSF